MQGANGCESVLFVDIFNKTHGAPALVIQMIDIALLFLSIAIFSQDCGGWLLQIVADSAQGVNGCVPAGEGHHAIPPAALTRCRAVARLSWRMMACEMPLRLIHHPTDRSEMMEEMQKGASPVRTDVGREEMVEPGGGEPPTS